MKFKYELAKRLRENDLTASQLSRLTGVPTSTISDYLAGREPKKISHLKKIADAFGITVDELMFGGDKYQWDVDLNEVLPDGWMSGVFEVRLRRVKRKKGGTSNES